MRELKPQMVTTKGLGDRWVQKIRDHYMPKIDLQATVKGALGITPAYKELMLKVVKRANVHQAWVERKNLQEAPNREQCIEMAVMEVIYAQHLSRFTRPSMIILDTQLDAVGPRGLAPIIAQEMMLAIQLEPKYERAFAVAIMGVDEHSFDLMPMVFPTIGDARQRAKCLGIRSDNQRLFRIIDLKMIWEENENEN